MSAKTVLIFCIQAFFIQIVLSQQCTSRAAIDASGFPPPYGRVGYSQASPAYDRVSATGLGYNGLAGRRPCDGYYPATEFSGGGLPVTSISSISPTGITVKSDNAFEGALMVTGELPFVSAVGVEGNLASFGAGATQYGCGNGEVAMLSEGPAAATYGNSVPGAYTPGFNPAFGVGSGFGAGPALGMGNSFNSAANFGPSAGFAAANRLGYGGCGRGMLY